MFPHSELLALLDPVGYHVKGKVFQNPSQTDVPNNTSSQVCKYIIKQVFMSILNLCGKMVRWEKVYVYLYMRRRVLCRHMYVRMCAYVCMHVLCMYVYVCLYVYMYVLCM